MGLNAAGALPPPPELAAERNVTEIRGTYGYGHPNTFGGLVFGLTLAWGMLRARRPRWVDAGLTAAVAFLCWWARPRARRGYPAWRWRPGWLCAACGARGRCRAPCRGAVRRRRAAAGGGELSFAAGSGQGRPAVGGLWPRMARAHRLCADRAALDDLDGLPPAGCQDRRAGGRDLAFGRQQLCVHAVPVRPGWWPRWLGGRADRGAVGLRAAPAARGSAVPAGHAGVCRLWNARASPDDQPRGAAAGRGGVCSAAAAVGGRMRQRGRRSRRHKTTVSITKRQRPGAGLCLYAFPRQGAGGSRFWQTGFLRSPSFCKTGCSPAWRSNRPGSRHGGSARGCRPRAAAPRRCAACRYSCSPSRSRARRCHG